jgi:hypothetical protein
MQTGQRLRDFFATLLLFCSPAKPERLWNEFREHICDDLGYRLRHSGHQDLQEGEILDYGLWLIERVLMKTQRRQLKDFPDMPIPEHHWEGVAEKSLIGEQLDTHQQIISSVESQAGQTFFLNGPGGTGQTFVYNTVCNTVRGHGWIVLCVVSSGIASLLLCGGRTAHSMFKIPLPLNPESTCPIPKEGGLQH